MEFLQDIILILSFALATSLVTNYLKVPNLIGFIIAGALIGPHGLKLISTSQEVAHLAELGIVLLLFTVGLEFSPTHLGRLRRVATIGGSLQILLSMIIIGGAYYLFSQGGPGKAMFIGAFAALSSTAIVLTMLQQKGELEGPKGQLSLGILLFQDLAIVPLLLLVPFWAGADDVGIGTLGMVLAKSAVILLLVYVLGRWVVGYFMDLVAKTRSRELFVLAVLVLCLGIGLGTHVAGLSYSLGAFLAGFILARSQYNYQAVADIMPFRDFLTCFFFISIGMLFDPQVFIADMPCVVGLALAIFLVKAVIIILILRVLGYETGLSALVGLGLFQIGEFSFVLSQEAMKFNLLGEYEHQLLISISILTMLATPLVVELSERLKFFRLRKTGREEMQDSRDHMVIVGFGVIGRALKIAAQKASIPYTIIELNPETVKAEKLKGEPIVYGDAIHDYILREAGVAKARVLAVTIPDAKGVRRIVSAGRSMNARLHIIARTRYVSEIMPLSKVGANDVIPEELVAALEIFHRTLKIYMLSDEAIDQAIADLSRKHYKLICPEGQCISR